MKAKIKVKKISIAILAILIICQIAVASEMDYKKNGDNIIHEQSNILTESRAFLWENGKMKALSSLGGTESDAHDININGNIVGDSKTSTGTEHAVFWKKGNIIGITMLAVTDNYCTGFRINDKDQVMGNCESSDFNMHGFIWDETSGIHSIGDLGGGTSEAMAINNNGQVVGRSITNGIDHAVIWDKINGLKDLGALSPTDDSYANDINNKGQAVGVSYTSQAPLFERAFIWDKVNGMKKLNGIPKGASTAASHINDNGQVVGRITYSNGKVGVFIWDKAHGMKDIGTLGGNYTSVYDINNNGQVIGESKKANGNTHAFLWDKQHGMKDLGTLGRKWSSAYDINEKGQITGQVSNIGSGFERGFVIKQNGGSMSNIGSLGGGDVWPHAINEKGQIVGHSH